MTFQESEALAILFEEGSEKLGTPEDPDWFIELISNEADASCKGFDGFEAFEAGFKLAQTAQWTVDEMDEAVYMQREGDYAWFFVGDESEVCQRVKNLIKKALKEAKK